MRARMTALVRYVQNRLCFTAKQTPGCVTYIVFLPVANHPTKCQWFCQNLRYHNFPTCDKHEYHVEDYDENLCHHISQIQDIAHVDGDNNLLIQSLCDKGYLDIALNVLKREQRRLSTDSYLALLRTCIKNKCLVQVKELSLVISRHHVPLEGFFGDYLLVALAKCGAVEDAQQLFYKLTFRTIFSWNAMISALVESEQGETALKLYDYMQEDDIAPDSYTYVSLIKACGQIRDVNLGRKLHSHACKKDFAGGVFVGGALISMYGKVGAIPEAEDVFWGLLLHNNFSWNFMLSAYLEQGDSENAILLYRQMLEEEIIGDHHTVLYALRACCLLAERKDSSMAHDNPQHVISLEVGQAVYIDALRKGFTMNNHIGTTLMTMYAKSAAIEEAENVFIVLCKCNPVSWNALLSAYMEHGKEKKALQLYVQMRKEGLKPHELTYVLSLKACSALAGSEETSTLDGLSVKAMSLEIGQGLHLDADTSGHASSVLVGTALLAMYGKCGAISKAEDIFTRLERHDVVSWNAMLSAYIEQGEAVKTLLAYRQMFEEGIHATPVTLMLALQACGILCEKLEYPESEGATEERLLEIVQALHADARKKGFASDLVVGNTLVSVYGKCGSFLEAEQLCSAFPCRNIITWNAMLSAYVDQMQGVKALLSHVELQREGITPDQLTFVICLQACSFVCEKNELLNTEANTLKDIILQIGKAIHEDANKNGFGSSVYVGTALLSMYGKCGAISEAENVFGSLSQRDAVAWNALLTAYIEQGHGEKALQLYRLMRQESPILCQQTLIIALQACGALARKEEALIMKGQPTKVISLELGQALHEDAYKEGYMSNVVVGNMLVSMYGKCGAVDKAEDVFGEMSHHDLVSWNALLSTCIGQSQGEQALRLYKQIQEENVALDDITLLCILQACSSTGSLEMCRHVHFAIVSAGYGQHSSLAVTLLHAYGSCSCMSDAEAMFHELIAPDIMSWNAYISGLAAKAKYLRMAQSFGEMKMTHVQPDELTFTSILSCCSHTGHVIEGLEYFNLMKQNDYMKPDIRHYGSLVDMLGRSGDFRRTKSLLQELPMQANLAIWLSLLGACQTHGNVELGKQAFEHAINLQPEHSTAYITMSNISATIKHN